MISFEILIAISILFGILTIIFIITAIVFFILNKDKKSSILSMIATLLTAVVSLPTYLNVDIPSPTIYPLDNETQIYTGEVEITIKTDEMVKTNKQFYTYYSMDGTDPTQGYVYDEPFIITNSATISAKNRFLFWWSDMSKEGYKFDEQPESKKTDKEKTTQSTTAPIPETQQSTESEETITETESTTTIASVETVPANPPETTAPQPISSQIAEGQQFDEAYKLMTYINQYRANAGVPLLNWDDELASLAQQIAYNWAYDINDTITTSYYFDMVGRRTMGPVTTTAEVAVSAWITGNNDIPSEAHKLLSENFTTIGGAMYYRPDSDPFHYFWAVTFR